MDGDLYLTVRAGATFPNQDDRTVAPTGYGR
jgi:hypothetical protein